MSKNHSVCTNSHIFLFEVTVLLCSTYFLLLLLYRNEYKKKQTFYFNVLTFNYLIHHILTLILYSRFDCHFCSGVKFTLHIINLWHSLNYFSNSTYQLKLPILRRKSDTKIELHLIHRGAITSFTVTLCKKLNHKLLVRYFNKQNVTICSVRGSPILPSNNC